VRADLKQVGIEPKDHAKVNVNGSGISPGHPLAPKGARGLVTLLHALRRRGVRYGLECICGGAGLVIAGIFVRK